MLLRYLRTPDNHEATVEAVTNPAQWAVLMVEECCRRRRGHGDRVDEDDVDWSAEHHPEREPREAGQHAATVGEKTVRQPDFYCLDRDACGLTVADFLRRRESRSCISEQPRSQPLSAQDASFPQGQELQDPGPGR